MRFSGAVLVALVVVLAGCAGGTGVPGTGTDAGNAGDAENAGTVADGNVNFYLSDRPNDIDDFEHLNVTVTEVGFHRTGGNGSDGEWITREVDGATVDLTELQGANASRIAALDLPDGTYDKVFVYVDEVNGTLEGGESVRVKLPSGKLQVNEGFAVGPNASVDFVFDISVHRAGNSGKYILKPVVAESGTDVPIDDVDEEEGEDEADEGEKSETGDEKERTDDSDGDENLNASFVGSVAPNASATVEVTRNGSPVAGANVTVNGESVGETNAQGRITFGVPDGEELEVEITAGEAEAELEREFEDEEDGEDEGKGNGRLAGPIAG